MPKELIHILKCNVAPSLRISLISQFYTPKETHRVVEHLYILLCCVLLKRKSDLNFDDRVVSENWDWWPLISDQVNSLNTKLKVIAGALGSTTLTTSCLVCDILLMSHIVFLLLVWYHPVLINLDNWIVIYTSIFNKLKTHLWFI